MVCYFAILESQQVSLPVSSKLAEDRRLLGKKQRTLLLTALAVDKSISIFICQFPESQFLESNPKRVW